MDAKVCYEEMNEENKKEKEASSSGPHHQIRRLRSETKVLLPGTDAKENRIY